MMISKREAFWLGVACAVVLALLIVSGVLIWTQSKFPIHPG